MNQTDQTDLEARAKAILNNLNQAELVKTRAQIETELNQPDIWNDPEHAGQLNQKLSRLNEKLKLPNQIQNLIENIKIAAELNEEESIRILSHELQNIIEDLENDLLFSGQFDSENCFLSLQSGAGGVDAQDWAAMLLAMYQAFCKNQKLDCMLVSLSLNPEGGVKNAMLEIKGEHAFGLLKEEVGVHRLVRLSPFNSGQTRETSFALVEALPASVENSELAVNIDEKDLRWEVSTSQGAGGQSVNTTYSAVKVIHEPTGLTVSCQNERSQIQNRAQALKILKSRLVALEIQKRQDLKAELKGDFKSPEWGSQIRNYVLHPYKLVKDTRSGWESSNPSDVLEQGNLLPIILSVKKSRVGLTKE